jgi:hypothetical protein
MARHRAPWPAMGELTGEGREEEGERERWGVAVGGAMGGGAAWGRHGLGCSVLSPCS